MTERTSNLSRIAAANHGIVVGSDVRRSGWHSESAPRKLADRGALVRVDRGVYAVGYEPAGRSARLMIAVRSAGEGAAVSHRAAAQSWNCSRRRKEWIEVSTPRRRGDRPGIVLHQRIVLPPEDVTLVEEVPTTTPVRTMADLATVIGADELAHAMHQALYHELTTELELAARGRQLASERARGSRTFAVALSMNLDDCAGTMSRFEDELAAFVRPRSPVPPLLNLKVELPDGGVAFLDQAWPAYRIYLEGDGFVHRFAATRRRDAARTSKLAALGWTEFRVTDTDFRRDPNRAMRPLLDAVWSAHVATNGSRRPQ